MLHFPQSSPITYRTGFSPDKITSASSRPARVHCNTASRPRTSIEMLGQSLTSINRGDGRRRQGWRTPLDSWHVILGVFLDGEQRGEAVNNGTRHRKVTNER